MGVGKSCLLHQFTEKKCKYSEGNRNIYVQDVLEINDQTLRVHSVCCKEKKSI
jgi:hypothetical protein